MRQQEGQQLSGRYSKGALLWVKFNPAKVLKGLAQIVDQTSLVTGFDDDAVDAGLRVAAHL
jgi:hypothetical protein